MKIKIIAFGIAKDILKAKEMDLKINSGETISALRGILVRQYPEFGKLKSLSFAVGVDYQEDSFQLSENDEVVIIPPVSGG